MKKFFVTLAMILCLLAFAGICFADGVHCNSGLCNYSCRCRDTYAPQGCPNCGAYCGSYSNVGFGFSWGYYYYPRPIYHYEERFDDRDMPDIHDIHDYLQDEKIDWGEMDINPGDFDFGGGDMGDF